MTGLWKWVDFWKLKAKIMNYYGIICSPYYCSSRYLQCFKQLTLQTAKDQEFF